jgi:hypothetical protein
MNPIRTVLAHDDEEPICHACSKAYGLVQLDKAAMFAMQTCCICETDQPCCAIGDFAMPASDAPARRQPHVASDDYSELETLLGGPRT